jgi:serine/threonine protein kinase
VQPDRDKLQIFADDRLSGQAIQVSRNSDRRTYTLEKLLSSQGKTSIAWKASDELEGEFAIKFVLQNEYQTHSLQAEVIRANSLNSKLFAKIVFFGEPSFSDESICGDDFYVIVVQWITGRTFKDYLSDPSTEITPDTFRQLSRDLCEALQLLNDEKLVHNDLHDENLLVYLVHDNLTQDVTIQLAIIDTGQIKTEDRRNDLIEQWQQKIETLEEADRDNPGSVAGILQYYRRLVNYFSRTDHEWIVHHLTTLYNCMYNLLPSYTSNSKRFLHDLPSLLRSMIDPDPSRRMSDPRQMYLGIEQTWSNASFQSADRKRMHSPFDLPSAELIRSDRQLMDLFSEEYPGLELCRSEAPVYLYGPRGCGKSTILRSLSLKAALASKDPHESISKVPFLGVYISSSQELRSRFWLMQTEDFEQLVGHIVRFFTFLLIESLLGTLEEMFEWDSKNNNSPLNFGMTENVAVKCVHSIRDRLNLDVTTTRYARTSCLFGLRQQIRQSRDQLWLRILNRHEPPFRPDPQMIFDICHSIEEICPSLRERRICFLIDDYSNQRIPEALQKKLNHVITFAKQGTPIFKVTSEYDGVNLEGLSEGREVNEVNVGFEYISIQNTDDRYRFLYNVLQRRFNYMELDNDILQFLPPSNLKPAIPLARAIREAHEKNKKFYYHGIDTISDLCSGDFAMGIDLVRRIFEHGDMKWDGEPKEIPKRKQDAAIREYTRQEFEYIRYHSQDGRQKTAIAEALGWLSKQCILTKDTDKSEKEGKTRIVPVIKNHLDISESALQELEKNKPDGAVLLRDLISKGVLFPIQDSRSREGHKATKRLMLRRILLAKHQTALGRDQAIRIDDVQRLIFFLTEPNSFAEDELKRTSSKRESAPKQYYKRYLFDDRFQETDNDA